MSKFRLFCKTHLMLSVYLTTYSKDATNKFKAYSAGVSTGQRSNAVLLPGYSPVISQQINKHTCTLRACV